MGEFTWEKGLVWWLRWTLMVNEGNFYSPFFEGNKISSPKKGGVREFTPIRVSVFFLKIHWRCQKGKAYLKMGAQMKIITQGKYNKTHGKNYQIIRLGTFIIILKEVQQSCI